IYDNSEYKVIVDVSKKADGDYEAKTSYEKENKLIDGVPIFKNTSSAKAALIKLQAEKTLDDKAPKDGRFSFILTDEKGQVLQRKSNKEGKILFDEFPIKEEGSKIFYLKEEVGTDKDIIYDKSEYKVIVVTKKDKDGNYEASITYKKAGKTFEGSPIFKNKIKVKTLPSTGQAKSSIPLLGGGLLLVGIALTFSQKKKEN
ncbi:MAG TPA: FctA domain-containing protein, partial [Clostridia bacterium]|nr:FctA domain-containing protein [Clostridia bacterium]